MDSYLDALQVQLMFDPLKPREIEILGLLTEGLSNAEIAQNLHLTAGTVKWYNSQIYSKLMVKNRTQASKIAQEHNLLDGSKIMAIDSTQILHNIPAQMNSFIGRQQEISDIQEILTRKRMTTMTGPGGTGKTCLAFQVAKRVLEYYRDGVWLVELGALDQADQVIEAIANALKISVRGDTPPISAVKSYLKHKNLLLLMDNFEHLLTAAPLVGELLSEAPQLSVLATSREALGIYGEQEYPISPLEIPSLPLGSDQEKLLDYDSIKLFISRAQEVKPSIIFDDEELIWAAKICRKLDGLPLAIELAAPLVKMYSLPTIEEKVVDLDFLPEGPQNLPHRQRTLRTTIKWSYELLEQDQKLVFYRLATFNNRRTLDAIRQICGDQISTDIEDILTALMNKNLIMPREGRDGEIDFKILETIREFAEDLLAASEESESLSQKHADYFASLAENANLEIRGEKNVYWFKRLQAEKDNLHAAIDWSFKGTQPMYGIRITCNLRYMWQYSCLESVGIKYALLALEKKSILTPKLKADLMWVAGELYFMLAQPKEGNKFMKKSMALYGQIGDRLSEAWNSACVATSDMSTPKKIDQGIALVEGYLSVFEEYEDLAGLAFAYNILGDLARTKRDIPSAKKYYQRSLELARQTGEKYREAILHTNMGFIAFHEGEYRRAEKVIKDGLSIFLEVDSSYGIAAHAASLAGPTAMLGFPKRAVRLLGAAAEQMNIKGSKYQAADQPEIEMYINLCKDSLGEKEFQSCWEEGNRMTVLQAINYALEELEYGDIEESNN